MDDPSALEERLAAGEVRLHELEELTSAAAAVELRRETIATETGVALDAVAPMGFAAAAATANIENLIGAVGMPLGVAGPLPVHGEAIDDEVYLPLATTEGALVASVNRGASVMRAAGGVHATITRRGMTRAPVFRHADARSAAETAAWVHREEPQLAAVAGETTSHGELTGIDTYVVGDNLFVRCAFDTKDAMGMNMVTIATRAIAETIEAATDATLVALSGNLCTDKKPAAINAVEGRGRSVTADVLLPHALVEERLVEGANAITTASVREEGLYLSVSLASLEVGTVGGGTRLPAQQTALELLGVAGGGDPPGRHGDALAEVIAGAAVAGELSLLAALASRHLTTAHASLGR
jgi:hydroxymethylglutaryl-CoA reductase (NADPH)